MGYIYLITNTINNKKYVGQTSRSIQERWKEHCRSAVYHKEKALYRAFLKYGINNFTIQEIENCDNEILSTREQYWIKYYDSYNNGYNMTMGGEGTIYYDFSYQELYELYYTEGKTAMEIANILECSIDTVYDRLKEYNLTKTNSTSKKNNREVETFYQGNRYVFRSQAEAARWCLENNLGHGKVDTISANIGRVCKGTRQTCCNLKWKFIMPR